MINSFIQLLGFSNHDIKIIMISAIGGLVGYLYRYYSKQNNKPDYQFKISLMIMFIIFGVFSGLVINDLLPNSLRSYETSIVSIISLSGYQFIDFLTNTGYKHIVNRIALLIRGPVDNSTENKNSN